MASPGATPARVRLQRLARIAHEPLLHFVVLGLAIFLAHGAWLRAHDSSRIVVTAADAAGLARKYRIQFGAAPSPSQMEALIQAHVEEEALFRQGVALGLDRGDEIVRRRIAQKAEFLQQDLAPPHEPSARALRAYYDAHRTAYAAEARMAFRHVFFSPDLDGVATARQRAQAALARLSRDPSAAVAGDPFPDTGGTATVGEAVRLFGDSEMAHSLGAAPVGRWSGPYRSGFGWHLLLIQSRKAGGARPFEAVREQVRADLARDAQAQADASSRAQLLSHYTVVRADRLGAMGARR